MSNGGLDRFVRELAEPLAGADTEQALDVEPPPMERILEVFAAHDIQLLGPPGTLPG